MCLSYQQTIIILLLSSQIDRVIVPSDWVKKLYIEKSKKLKDTIFVWPSPIDVNQIKKEGGKKK